MPSFEAVDNAPRYLVKFLNWTPAERNQLDKADLATLTELETLTDHWLKAKGNRPRFIGRVLGAGRSARPFTEFKIQWSITSAADTPGYSLPCEGSTHAEGIFLQFLLHPDHWRLGGPCQQCGKYFLKATRHKKLYCSSKCARFRTALQSTRDARQEDRNRKLDAIKSASEEWQRIKTKEDWRAYVARQAGVTEKLL